MATVTGRVLDGVKRLVVGRALASAQLEHQLLPKTLALPVFSSDPLSSVAYATEEMMLVLVAAGAAALSLMAPIAIVIGLVLAIVITSYRQTVRAYPQGGGSYIVARQNLGEIPGLIAAAAILIDYVLTVAVSVTAGTLAITSAAPSLAEHKVLMTLGFIFLIALANLRGVREAGALFAFPTYGFVVMVYVTLMAGFVDCLDGCPIADSADVPLEAGASLTLFLILRAFASGSTALTGVEAIADGVQAFRRPQSKNAATTLAIMGAMSISMFLGITVLARALQIRATEEISEARSVLAQIGDTIFGESLPFFLLQGFTAGILILAANTSYQDFPRLSAILARDHFMPRQFTNRGDRLVFSNGILVLSALAALLVWIFDANLTRLIQLYVVGVFTAFTLSQSGMVRRWLKLRGPGWKRSAIINGIGATATGLVLLIVAATKFIRGAWIVIVAIPIVVILLRGVHRHYTHVHERLHRGEVSFGRAGANRVILVLTDIDAAASEALGYIRSFRPTEVRTIYVGARPSGEVQILWDRLARTSTRIEFPEGRDRVDAVIDYIRRLPREPGDFITVVIPELFRRRSLLHAIRRPVTFRLKVRLLREPQIVVTDVPVLSERGQLVGVDARPLPPERTSVLVFISGVHDAAIRALNYARSLRGAETRAVCVALDPEEARDVPEQWLAAGINVQLDIVDAPFRDLGPPVLEEVRRVTRDPEAIAAVILPE
ncbi:MAG TPA: APC family permease, partial [Actinomycetota bacterium]|nr:APC family permease [Actinomycetota bacterium]